ncbi:MAG: hypothetical protein KAU14_03770, partial [Thermoplasmata archaeon]|nr:hypothetical protein [Thermoplasmata archaeon]
RNARFTLTAPNASELDSGNQEALLKLTVSSKDNTSVEEEAQIKAKIAQLVVKEAFKEAFPGENAGYEIEIFNADSDPNNVKLSIRSNSRSWPAGFNDTDFVVGTRESVIKLLNVTVPGFEDPNNVTTIEIRAHFAEQAVDEYVVIKTRAKQGYGVEITSFTDLSHVNITNDSLEPGETHGYLLTFRNTGNWYDNLSFSADAPKGWVVEFSPSEVLNMRKNTSRTVTVNITASEEEWAYSNHTLRFWVFSMNSSDARDFVDLNITILRTRGVGLMVNQTDFPILPHEEIHINLSVRNTGNWYENFTIALSGLPNNFTCSLEEATQTYDPYEEKDLILTITAPQPLDPQVRAG